MSAELKKLLVLVAMVVAGTAFAVHGYVRSLDAQTLAAAVRVEGRRAPGTPPAWAAPACAAPLECAEHRAETRHT